MPEDRALIIQVPRDNRGEITGGAVKAFVARKNALGQWVYYSDLHRFARHSPDGFNIGYHGSGCAELAQSICFYFGAESLYQQFKAEVIARLNRKDHIIPFDHLRMMIEEMKTRGRMK